jgi:hypothetical protein
LRRLHPQDWQTASFNRLLSDRRTFDAIVAGRAADEAETLYQAELNHFRERRERFLLY